MGARLIEIGLGGASRERDSEIDLVGRSGEYKWTCLLGEKTSPSLEKGC